MNQQTFDRLFAEQVDRSRNVLCEKAKEYAIGDRLHNFKVAAELQNCSVPEALAGMMAKHTISVYDMCRDPNWEDFPLSLWEEKLGDHINYLFLLNAAVREAYENNEEEKFISESTTVEVDGEKLAATLGKAVKTMFAGVDERLIGEGRS